MIESNKDPLVSVIIPTHNRARLVARAIESVLNQTYKHLEIIVVDDASTDNTKEVIAGYDDPRISYLLNERNIKAPASRNRGIKIAKGQYISFLDDDDELLPQKIEKQVSKFLEAKKNVGVVYCGYCFVTADSGDTLNATYPKYKGNVYSEMLLSCLMASHTLLIKKESFEMAGLFDEDLPSCQDWDMWIRLSKITDFDFIPEALAKVYVHGSQISTDLSAKIRARTAILQKYEKELEQNPDILCYHLKRLGVLHFIAGEYATGRKYIIDALKIKPTEMNSYLHAGLSLFPGIYKKLLERKCTTKINGITFYY
jgi:glycosyltransferase involved in cell wall biosynthesis